MLIKTLQYMDLQGLARLTLFKCNKIHFMHILFVECIKKTCTFCAFGRPVTCRIIWCQGAAWVRLTNELNWQFSSVCWQRVLLN